MPKFINGVNISCGVCGISAVGSGFVYNEKYAFEMVLPNYWSVSESTVYCPKCENKRHLKSKYKYLLNFIRPDDEYIIVTDNDYHGFINVVTGRVKVPTDIVYGALYNSEGELIQYGYIPEGVLLSEFGNDWRTKNNVYLAKLDNNVTVRLYKFEEDDFMIEATKSARHQFNKCDVEEFSEFLAIIDKAGVSINM